MKRAGWAARRAPRWCSVRRLRSALRDLNPDLPEEASSLAADELTRDRTGTLSLVQANREVYDLLRGGVSVTYQEPGEGEVTRTAKVLHRSGDAVSVLERQAGDTLLIGTERGRQPFFPRWLSEHFSRSPYWVSSSQKRLGERFGVCLSRGFRSSLKPSAFARKQVLNRTPSGYFEIALRKLWRREAARHALIA